MNDEPPTRPGELGRESRKLVQEIEARLRGENRGDQQLLIKEVPAEDSKAFSKLKDALLLAAILGLVGVVWNMSINVAKLEATVAALRSEITELKQRIKP